MDNNASVNIFLSLLRSGLYGVPIPESELPESIDWGKVILFAKKQAVLGTIIESVQYLPERLRPSKEISSKMFKFAMKLIKSNVTLDETIAHLVTFFAPYGINGVLLKGQGVARYYRKPEMRHSGDIDFYVGKANYKKAVALCKEKLIKSKNDYDETELHLNFQMHGVIIEVHRLASRVYSPLRRRPFQRWLKEELEQSSHRRPLTIDNVEVTLPSYDFDAIYIFYHAWRHYILGGIGLRQLCDWAMIFHSHGHDIDKRRLEENVKRFGLTKAWKLFAYIIVKYLGLPESEMPLYDPTYSKQSEKILEEIFAGGNFGHYFPEASTLPTRLYGLKYGLRKVHDITKCYISLFPIIPIEATFLFFHRLIYGTIFTTKRAIRASSTPAQDN